MSMIGNIQSRQKLNPTISAEEADKELRRKQNQARLAREAETQRPDTTTGAFLPGQEMPSVDIAPQQNLSVAESNAVRAMQNVSDQSTRAVNQARDLAEARMASQARLAAQQQTYPAQQGQYGGFTGSTNGSGDGSGVRQQIVNTAASYAGTPYQLGGTTATGIDCSGLVMAVYNKFGMGVTQHSAGWQGRNIPGVRTSVSNLKPGDIVAWRDGSHIAVYAGNGQIWDASRSRGTSLRPLWAPLSDVYGIAIRLPGE